jgi:hypothetical protein
VRNFLNGGAPLWKRREKDPYAPIYRENVYVSRRKNRLPSWMPPLITLLIIVLIVFYLAPVLSRRFISLTGHRDSSGQSIARSYTDQDRVVQITVADVYAKADIKAERLAQALYNEPVTLVNEPTTYGFCKVRLQDGLVGYMRVSDLSAFCDSAEPGLAVRKLVVTTGSKRIMSHARTGTLVAEVMMGTILYADYRGDGISRVRLPNGRTGWLSDDGLVILAPTENIQPVADGARYFTNTALTFLNVTLLEHGLTIRGACVPGIACVSAAVNGIRIPRQMEGQLAAGTPVELVPDGNSGLTDRTILKPGDLLFFRRSANQPEISQMAICITPDSLLVENQGRSSIRLTDATAVEVPWENLVAVRRLFP